jgi:malate synthase
MAGSQVDIRAPIDGRAEEVLTPAPLDFLSELQRRFNPTRKELVARRAERQKRFDAGQKPDFLAETQSVRDGDWKVAPVPADLQDRRVEITGPTDRRTAAW